MTPHLPPLKPLSTS